MSVVVRINSWCVMVFESRMAVFNIPGGLVGCLVFFFQDCGLYKEMTWTSLFRAL